MVFYLVKPTRIVWTRKLEVSWDQLQEVLARGFERLGVVLDVGPKGSYYERQVYDPNLVECGGEFNAYLSTMSGEGVLKGQAISLAFCRKSTGGLSDWRLFDKNPILKPDKTWDSWFVRHGCTIREEKEYLMYYTGFNGEVRQIGLAVSKDGVVFSKYEENPVLKPSDDEKELTNPAVVKWDGKYFMYYCVFMDKSKNQLKRIRVAVSEDGLTWQKIGEAIRVGEEGEWDCHFIEWHSAYVLKDGILLLYEGYNGKQWSIGVAFSEDGVNFTKYEKNPIFRPSGVKGAFDEYHVATPFMILEGDRLLLIYSGGESPHYPTSLWRLGLARTKEL